MSGDLVNWASDVPISMPVPPPRNLPILIDLGGFGFTLGGLAHNLSQSDVEALSVPFFAPDGAFHE